MVQTRFTRWAKAGVWERVFKYLAKDADNEYAMIDFDHRACSIRKQRREPSQKKSRRRRSDRPQQRRIEHQLMQRLMLWAIRSASRSRPDKACDLDGADILLPQIEADIVIAEKASTR